MRKPFKEISWQVDEPTYRADPALSYSTLAKYERGGGFKALSTLKEEISTSSLIFGSMVDSLLTGGEEEFRNRFIIIDDLNLSDTLKDITQALFSIHKEDNMRFDDIPDAELAEIGKQCDFWAGDKYTVTRVKKIREGCKAYYNTLFIAKDKTIVSPEDVEDARRCVDAFKNSSTGKYFQDNDPFNDRFEGYYQLKFKGTDPITGIEYRCMADRIIIDHQNKMVIPIDVKTSSHEEYEFYKSFVQWRYDIQASLYWRLIRQNMDEDDYFKDFSLANYRFIVINRFRANPLAWEWPLTQKVGDIEFMYPSGYKFVMRDPFTIGKELFQYLNENDRKNPFEISENSPNNILSFLLKNRN